MARIGVLALIGWVVAAVSEVTTPLASDGLGVLMREKQQAQIKRAEAAETKADGSSWPELEQENDDENIEKEAAEGTMEGTVITNVDANFDGVAALKGSEWTATDDAASTQGKPKGNPGEPKCEGDAACKGCKKKCNRNKNKSKRKSCRRKCPAPEAKVCNPTEMNPPEEARTYSSIQNGYYQRTGQWMPCYHWYSPSIHVECKLNYTGAVGEGSARSMLDSEFAWVSYDEPWAPDLDSYSGDASPHSAWMAGGTGRRTYKDGAEEQYMIMDLGSVQKVKGVITQPKHQIGVGPGGGRGDEYVLKFVVQYSEDNAVWQDIGVVLHGPEGTGQKGKLSGGEADERVKSLFPTAVDARYVKIVAKVWMYRISMRAGVLTC